MRQMSEGTYGRAPQQLGQLRTSDTTASACTETVHLRLLSLCLLLFVVGGC